MEKINFIHQTKGRKVRHGTIDMIAGYSFAIIPVKAEGIVYLAMPGAQEDFLQVDAEKVGTGTLEGAEMRLRARTEDRDIDHFDLYSSRTLQEVRAKKTKYHREYLLGLLAEYEAYNGEQWK